MHAAEIELKQYLDKIDSFLASGSTTQHDEQKTVNVTPVTTTSCYRTRCLKCYSSCSIYCPNCCEVQLPPTQPSVPSFTEQGNRVMFINSSSIATNNKESNFSDDEDEEETNIECYDTKDDNRIESLLRMLDGKTNINHKTNGQKICQDADFHCPFVLPFHVDILLDDRRTTSTGIQLQTMYNFYQNDDNNNRVRSDSTPSADKIDKDNELFDGGIVKLYDCCNASSNCIPDYSNESNNDGTYVLFPCSTSIPLSKLLQQQQHKVLQKLVVLDCKWSTTKKLLNIVKDLPCIHFDLQVNSNKHGDNNSRTSSSCNEDCTIDTTSFPAIQNSYYWRWHNSGLHCVSTIEAIYYSAYQVLEYYYYHANNMNNSVVKAHVETTKTATIVSNRIINMMYLFAFQRSLIHTMYTNGSIKLYKRQNEMERYIPPYTAEAKRYNLSLRNSKTKK